MPDPGPRPTHLQVVAACARRARTCVPAAAGVLLALTAAPGAWLLGPLLVLGGAASFLRDLAVGEVADELARRMREHQEALADDAVLAIAEGLPDADLHAIVTVRQLEKSVLARVVMHQKVLELTGTFSHTCLDMVRSVASSATAALRRKRALLEAVQDLKQRRADDEADRLCEQLPALDDTIEHARAALDEALTQLTLIENEADVARVADLADGFCARLKAAAAAAGETAGAVDTVTPGVLPLPEAADPERKRQTKRQGERWK